jgi:hypothetical protein
MLGQIKALIKPSGGWFEQVIENPSRFNLSPADRLLLEEGRKSMISHTRYGSVENTKILRWKDSIRAQKINIK